MPSTVPAPKGFFADKNRAFWTLQIAGWVGYFLLRSLGGLANRMGISFILLAGGEREHGQQGCKESDHGGLGFGTARGCRCRQAALFQKSRRVALAAAARRQGRRSP